MKTLSEPTAAKPTAAKPTAEKPTAEKPTAEKSAAKKPQTEQPTAGQPTAGQPVLLERLPGAVPPAPQPLQESSDSVLQLSHDLSGPLTSILIHCDLLLEDDLSPEARHRVETILSETLRIDERLRSSSRSL